MIEIGPSLLNREDPDVGTAMLELFQVAMLGQLPFTVLREALFTHPTAAEGLTVLLADVTSVAT